MENEKYLPSRGIFCIVSDPDHRCSSGKLIIEALFYAGWGRRLETIVSEGSFTSEEENFYINLLMASLHVRIERLEAAI